MSIFDLIGSTKYYKKGMEAGANPFIERFSQHADALKRLQKNFGEQWKQTKEIADSILNCVESNERARIYGMYASFDINGMDQDSKYFLIAALYRLSNDKSNELQQSYIRSVKNYLDIKNPQTINDFSGIKGIENLNAQKAILQSCMEYLLLAFNNADFFEQYDDSLFKHFEINQKTIVEIWENVLNIYSALGPLGLSEKYGFVIERTSEEESKIDEFDQVHIKASIEIKNDETKLFENKNVLIRADIHCEGELIFNNCTITYNGDNISSQIFMRGNSKLTFINCTIIGKNNDTPVSYGDRKFFITTHFDKDNASLYCKNTLFENCKNFTEWLNVHLEDSIIKYTTNLVFDSDLFKSCKEKSEVVNCLVYGTKENLCSNIFNGITVFSSSTFRFVGKSCINNFGVNRKYIIKNCHFEDCGKYEVFKDFFIDICTKDTEIRNCSFENCKNIIHCEYTVITFSQFNKCKGNLIKAGSGPTNIKNTEFYNIICDDIFSPSLDFFYYDYKSSHNIENCLFSGVIIKDTVLIATSSNSKPKSTVLRISDTEFHKCKVYSNAKLIDYETKWITDFMLKNKSKKAVSTNNCKGLDNLDNEAYNVDVVLRKETSSGEPIGARLDGILIGYNN